MKFQRWRPDTCDCVIIQTYDETLPQPIITVSKIEKACSFHAPLMPNEQAVYNAIVERNQRKNFSYAELELQVASSATLTPDLFDWTYDDTGAAPVLRIASPLAVTASAKKTLQARIDARLGAGKVIVL